MLKPALIVVALLALSSSAFGQTCLHGPDEWKIPGQQARRQQALQFAVKIHVAEASQAPRTRGFRPLGELNLPATPQGFSLRFLSDPEGYTFSLKDRMDPCGYTIFSDQDRDLYEAVPRKGGVVLPLGSGISRK